MSPRELSPAQLAQRHVAAVKSGATSRAIPRPSSETKYAHLRRAVVRASGKTTPRQRLQLRLLAIVLVRIERAERWLAQQPDEIFADAATGDLHPLIARVDHWSSVAAGMLERLPDAAKADLADAFPVQGRRRA